MTFEPVRASQMERSLRRQVMAWHGEQLIGHVDITERTAIDLCGLPW